MFVFSINVGNGLVRSYNGDAFQTALLEMRYAASTFGALPKTPTPEAKTKAANRLDVAELTLENEVSKLMVEAAQDVLELRAQLDAPFKCENCDTRFKQLSEFLSHCIANDECATALENRLKVVT
jgi:hypothetical protein